MRPAIVRSPVISTAASSVRSPEVVLMVSVVSLSINVVPPMRIVIISITTDEVIAI